MSPKTSKILSMVLMGIPSVLLLMSAFMKLSEAEIMVQNLTKAGLGNYIMLIGVIELISVGLFLFPKTRKVGFLLLCAYLGGALSIELAAGTPPTAAILLTLIWISVYLRDRIMFIDEKGIA